MTFQFRSAASVTERTPLVVGVAGGTGSGKTRSALRMARGVVGPKGKIALIDTESRRSLAHKHAVEFDFAELGPPFTPERYREAVEAAENAGYEAIIIDSASHIWVGDGGCLEMHDDAVEKMSGGDWRKAERVNILAWSKPKQRYKKTVSRLLQSRAHLFLCLRAEPKIKALKEIIEGREVTKYVDAGWQPLCEKMLPFEMTVSMMMHAERKGVPELIKCPDELLPAFDGQQLNEKTGELLAAFAANLAPGQQPQRTIPLVRADGGVQVIGTAAEWLAALKQLAATVDNAALAVLWDQNSDVFYRIENAARTREDAAVVAEVSEIGRVVMTRLAQAEGQYDEESAP